MTTRGENVVGDFGYCPPPCTFLVSEKILSIILLVMSDSSNLVHKLVSLGNLAEVKSVKAFSSCARGNPCLRVI